jgi:hypothetical protein
MDPGDQQEGEEFDVNALLAQINENFGLDEKEEAAKENEGGEEEQKEGESEKKFKFTEFMNTSEKNEETFEKSAIAAIISTIPFVFFISTFFILVQGEPLLNDPQSKEYSLRNKPIYLYFNVKKQRLRNGKRQ